MDESLETVVEGIGHNRQTALRAQPLRPASEAELPAKWPTLLVMAKWTAQEMLRWLAVMDK